MYKPGTQLIMHDLWAREAALKLGFEIAGGYRTVESVWFPRRIVVTSDGPNAAERFLPQRNDLIETVNDTHFIVTELLPDDPTWVGNKNQCGIQNPFIECRRIIERNGISFPQFSEVIEP